MPTGTITMVDTGANNVQRLRYGRVSRPGGGELQFDAADFAGAPFGPGIRGRRVVFDETFDSKGHRATCVKLLPNP